jgi:hypothetical protein
MTERRTKATTEAAKKQILRFAQDDKLKSLQVSDVALAHLFG